MPYLEIRIRRLNHLADTAFSQVELIQVNDNSEHSLEITNAYHDETHEVVKHYTEITKNLTTKGI